MKAAEYSSEILYILIHTSTRLLASKDDFATLAWYCHTYHYLQAHKYAAAVQTIQLFPENTEHTITTENVLCRKEARKKKDVGEM